MIKKDVKGFYKNKIVFHGKNHLINKITNNSKHVEQNDVFYFESNNISYLLEAIKKGCKSFVLDSCFKLPKELLNLSYNIIKVNDVKLEYCNDLYKMNKKLFKKLKIVTITGTNGKTTTSTIIYKFLRKMKKNALLIGSNGNYLNDVYYKTVNTTSDITTIYDLMKKLKKGYVIIEASSHGIKNLRLKNIISDICIFTNLTLDHLDFHKTYDDYKYTKLLHLLNSKMQIVNYDDSNYHLFSHYLNNFKTVSIQSGKRKNQIARNIDYLISNVKLNGLNHDGYITTFKITSKESKYNKVNLETNFSCLFNVYNVSFSYACLLNLGFKIEDIVKFFKEKIEVKGRMEYLIKGGVRFVVDFCHTPDGVMNVLKYFSQIKTNNNIYTVIGCGGSKDHLKRAIIGDIATDLSSYVIFTSDNPRSEKPLKIIDDIVNGAKKTNYEVVEDRKEAILKAYRLANENDYVLVLGKGIEEEIEYDTYKVKHNDIEFIKELEEK